MSKINDGGPAFPVAPFSINEGREEMTVAGDIGMSLRDWFAGRALSGMMSLTTQRDVDRHSPSELRARLAFGAYAQADAMLAEREKDKA